MDESRLASIFTGPFIPVRHPGNRRLLVRVYMILLPSILAQFELSLADTLGTSRKLLSFHMALRPSSLALFTPAVYLGTSSQVVFCISGFVE
ncbi:hypothetical protein DM01DRAFT_1335256 [Hesseltinella vesiculosa]|uniref:Uncharacterized protein n=1 Tax=Hesseltinella vesiculosa TaxID=101127 RepID=A0A1X2GJ49_9FUNG|nr:hypothetical protein DM01DRAFT_1335256 [Hesseltinella vesiculosa]